MIGKRSEPQGKYFKYQQSPKHRKQDRRSEP